LLAGCGNLENTSSGPATSKGGSNTSQATGASTSNPNWTLAAAAAPYKGTTIKAVFLNRPGYEAAIKLLPEFEQQTGIKVNYEVMPYENSREKQVLDFNSPKSSYDVILMDVVWVGEFATSGWAAPLEKFYNDPKLADPALNLKGFFPILLESFGTWNKKVYGLPFDNYSGLLFYNKCMLKQVGFDAPPKSWQELYDKYGPALTKDGKYAFALQSAKGETQSADSFMRMVWQAGGSLLDAQSFEPNLSSKESLAGLKFRQDLKQYMPPDITEWDHEQVVQGLAEGRIAMITEWSANYTTLANPATSKITNCLGVNIEPAGAQGPRPALGGFSLGINSRSAIEKQAASWLFIQWVTSEAKAKDYIRAGGVSARSKVYEDQELRQQYPYFEPLVESWNNYGNPIFRPRFPEWPIISEVISQIGSDMLAGKIGVEDGAKILVDKIRKILAPY
jgi:multiple sugar transport system substrate-binding protein